MYVSQHLHLAIFIFISMVDITLWFQFSLPLWFIRLSAFSCIYCSFGYLHFLTFDYLCLREVCSKLTSLYIQCIFFMYQYISSFISGRIIEFDVLRYQNDNFVALLYSFSSDISIILMLDFFAWLYIIILMLNIFKISYIFLGLFILILYILWLCLWFQLISLLNFVISLHGI